MGSPRENRGGRYSKPFGRYKCLAVDLLLTAANFLEQISLSQSIKIFLPFPVTKMLHILIFSAGLFHLTSKSVAVQGTGMA